MAILSIIDADNSFSYKSRKYDNKRKSMRLTLMTMIEIHIT